MTTPQYCYVHYIIPSDGGGEGGGKNTGRKCA